MVATRNLEGRLSGSGSSVYNTMRQMGAVVGSAAIAAMMSAQLERHLSSGAGGGGTGAGGAAAVDGPNFAGVLPAELHAPFAQAMSNSIWLPCAVIGAGAILACFFQRTQSWSA